uniref:GPI-anchored wall transfer protein 1 n=1 Tax=Arundo donax TaxID=35708 RepID=A0A0A9DMZ1_ARUDO
MMINRSQSHLKAGLNRLPSLRADISSYRVSVVLVTCVCILAVDFKIFPRRYAKAETYGSGIMDLGVGSFVVANALVSRQARNMTSVSFKAVLSSISPLVFLGFARIISTSGVDYQVHVGEYGVHWNFFFTLAAVSILTSIVRIHPKYCGLVGLLILAGYQIWLSFGLNEYLISDERSADIISQNKEGVFSVLGYWGMFLIGVSLGYYLLVDTSSKGKSRNTQVVKIWVLAASFCATPLMLCLFLPRIFRYFSRLSCLHKIITCICCHIETLSLAKLAFSLNFGEYLFVCQAVKKLGPYHELMILYMIIPTNYPMMRPKKKKESVCGKLHCSLI